LGIWIDTPQWHSPATLKARNVDGVIRYLCMPFNTGPGSALPNKRLERAELDQKIGAGIDVAVNWEDAADDYVGGYARGFDKGRRAGDWMLNVLGWPAGGSCCSSIDADIGAAWGGLARDYQRGFADGLTQEGPYAPGIYGSAPALNGARRDGTAHVFWLTAASSWSHGVRPDEVHIIQDGLWAGGGDADLDTIVTVPFGTYLQAAGGQHMAIDISAASLAEIDKLIRRALNVKSAFTIPAGLTENDRVLDMLVTFGRGQFNATNEIVATLGAIRANTGQLLDDETHILAAIAALPSIQFPADQIPVLAAAIANDIGTPVDEEKLATALSHDVIASLGAALSNG